MTGPVEIGALDYGDADEFGRHALAQGEVPDGGAVGARGLVQQLAVGGGDIAPRGDVEGPGRLVGRGVVAGQEGVGAGGLGGGGEAAVGAELPPAQAESGRLAVAPVADLGGERPPVVERAGGGDGEFLAALARRELPGGGAAVDGHGVDGVAVGVQVERGEVLGGPGVDPYRGGEVVGDRGEVEGQVVVDDLVATVAEGREERVADAVRARFRVEAVRPGGGGRAECGYGDGRGHRRAAELQGRASGRHFFPFWKASSNSPRACSPPLAR